MSCGVTPSFLAFKVIGTPCSSDPPINKTSSPLRRKYRTYVSAGTYTPARCPICTGPLAYGNADVTVVRLKFLLLSITVYFYVEFKLQMPVLPKHKTSAKTIQTRAETVKFARKNSANCSLYNAKIMQTRAKDI